MKRITLKHIARELDVSISTVSKALKDSDEISEETKKKVQAFAALYHYRPNNIALSLKSKQTKNIGVIIPDIVHPYFTTVFRGIEEYANTQGYNVMVCVSDESFEKEVLNMEMLANGSVDGFILALSGETEKSEDYHHLKAVAELGLPIVLFDRAADDILCDKVVTNDREIAYQAVVKLAEEGARRVGLFTTDDHYIVSRKRKEGYLQAVADLGLETDVSLILYLDYEDMDGALIQEYLMQQNVDGVLCVNEIFAVHSMRLAKAMGLDVPEDIAFIGFTDGVLSRYCSPTLTTVDQHGERVGRVAARMLIDKVESDDEDDWERYRTEVVKANIIERESTTNRKVGRTQ